MTRRGFSSLLSGSSASEQTKAANVDNDATRDSTVTNATGSMKSPASTPETKAANSFLETDGFSEQTPLKEPLPPPRVDGPSSAAPSPDDWESRWRRPKPSPKVEELVEQGPPRLDAPHPELERRLLQERRRISELLDHQLRNYDGCQDFRNSQDRRYVCRDIYEMERRGEASKEMHDIVLEVSTEIAKKADRRSLRSRYLHDERIEAPPPEPIVIIALMSVHIATEGRLQKLSQTLQSIQEQQLSRSEAILHVAVSWYSPEPALGARVQRAFHRFIDARDSAFGNMEDACYSKSSTGCRSKGRGSFARYAASVEESQPATGSRDGEKPAARTQSSGRPATVIIRQTERQTQFQHYRAALGAIEAELRRRWGLRSAESAHRSVWVIFGDDDDLWHCRRAAEFARAIRAQNEIDGIGVMATLTRAGVGLFEGQTHVPDRVLPTRAADVDTFLRIDYPKAYAGSDHAKDEACKNWMQSLSRHGDTSTDRPPPEELAMEHFDFSPRLRILHEFFDTTSEDVISHRFCDLRLCEFLETYPRMGREFGLKLHFFTPKNCWMYFYRNVGVSPDQLKKSLEQTNDDDDEPLPDVLFAQVEHVSAEVPITDADMQRAERVCEAFKVFDENITPIQLTKSFANFRGTMEHYVVRLHSRTIDQRRFDGLVVQNAMGSFGNISQAVFDEGANLTTPSAQMFLEECQDLAKEVATSAGVNIFWYKPDIVIVPACKITHQEAIAEPLVPNQNPSPIGKGGLKGKGKGILCSKGNGSALAGASGKGALPGGKGLTGALGAAALAGKGFPEILDALAMQDAAEESEVVETIKTHYKYVVPGMPSF